MKVNDDQIGDDNYDQFCPGEVCAEHDEVCCVNLRSLYSFEKRLSIVQLSSAMQ